MACTNGLHEKVGGVAMEATKEADEAQQSSSSSSNSGSSSTARKPGGSRPWNRDVSAAINILHIAFVTATNQSLLARFARSFCFV